MLRSLRSLSLVLATAGLLAPAAAHATPAHSAKKVSHASKKTSAKSTSSKTKVTYPAVKKVSPLKLGIGDKLTLTGTSFRSGSGKNFVVFKRDGGRALFVKADKSTTRQVSVTVPAKLLPFLAQKSGVAQPTKFRLRVMAKRLGKAYTTVSMSPVISPTSAAAGNSDDCDGDGVPNAKDSDDDNDLLPDTEEARLGTDPCKRDTDGDGMSDGWEQQSAIDRNGGSAVPSPTRKPYPNALNKDDANLDQDGDGLTNIEEYTAWASFGGNKFPLSYSGGNPASAGRGALTGDQQKYWDRDGNGYLSDFERDADGDGIPNMDEQRTGIEIGRLVDGSTGDETRFLDFGLFTDVYIGLAEKATETVQCTGINQVPFYCVDKAKPTSITVKKVDPTDWLSNDSDGDGIDDGNDDQDHDGVPNLVEWKSFFDNKGWTHKSYDQIDACIPNSNSASCLIGGVDIDKDGLVNAVDPDDDGDLLPDDLEKAIGTNPLVYDTDQDGVSDGFEYYSAYDLNGSAPRWPSSRPYPNPMDGTDAGKDFDQDSLSLLEEFKAWKYSYCGGGYQNCQAALPLTYSDGTSWSDPASGTSDDLRDVDGDGLNNWQETHGPLSSPSWWDAFTGTPAVKLACGSDYVESPYPGPAYRGTDFVNADTDNDGINDGSDDIDHDGYTNLQESVRPANWCGTYVSTRYRDNTGAPISPHVNDKARMQPFNPCKPTWSDYCHKHPPFGYYADNEDWAYNDGTTIVNGP
jgi:hypothetical protein